VPVTFRINLALQPFDVIGIFFGAAFAKSVGNLEIAGRSYLALLIMTDLRTTFFTFENALGALKNLLNRQNLSLSDDFSFFFFGML
jgi:hypothetical protein